MSACSNDPKEQLAGCHASNRGSSWKCQDPPRIMASVESHGGNKGASGAASWACARPSSTTPAKSRVSTSDGGEGRARVELAGMLGRTPPQLISHETEI